MSNYLKKLAYVHEAMKKLAASNDFPGMFIEMPMTYDLGLPTADEFKKQWGLSNAKQGLLPPELEDELSYAVTTSQTPSIITPQSRVALGGPDLDYIEHYAQTTSLPNNAASMMQMQPAYQTDPSIPISETIPTAPSPTLHPMYAGMANRGPTASYARTPTNVDKPSVLYRPNNADTDPGRPRSIIHSNRPDAVSYRYKGKNYSGREMAKRIDRFQKEYIKRYAAANAITEDEARTRLGGKGKLYDTSDMTSLIAQMNDPKLRRLRNIATGRKTIDNYKWRAPGGMEGMSYATAQQYMDDRRQNKMNKMHGGAAEQALSNPAAMPNMPVDAAQRPAQQPQGNLDPRINAMTSDKNTGDPIRNRVTSAYLK